MTEEFRVEAGYDAPLCSTFGEGGEIPIVGFNPTIPDRATGSLDWRRVPQRRPFIIVTLGGQGKQDRTTVPPTMP